MAVDLLDAPLRVSWDFFSDTDSSLSGEQLLQIATALTDAGLFYVTLENRPLKHPAVIPVVDQLLSGGCQVALIADADSEQLNSLAELPPGVNLFLDAAACVAEKHLDQQQLAGFFQQIRSLQLNASLLWLPRSGQLPLILDFIQFCEQNGVPCFKLPNQKIGANPGCSERESLPDCKDLQQFSVLLNQAELPKTSSLQLEVHDLFLWELLQPLCGGKRSEYGGCQAANSLGHIDHLGELWPCSSWPQSLGNLLGTELLDLWQSSGRLAVRAQITGIPTGCDGCRDYQICFGGCRGLATFCREDDLGRDLLCAKRR
jgi:GeoRSP system SPASM domain protein